MNKVIGFIGGGNMGSAMIGGVLKASIAPKEQVIASDINEAGLESLKNRYGINVTTNNVKLAQEADIIVLSIKPNIYKIVIDQIKEHIKSDAIIVSIGAGQSIDKVEGLFEKEIKLVRVMPNTPALVGEAMSALCPNKLVTEEELGQVQDIFNSFGKSEVVGEYLFDVVTAASGSSPAYVYMFIEAMADAAVLGGMPRDKAYKFCAQTVLGSAKMVLETGMHPGVLKDMVTSPAGTTIEGVAELEKLGMRNAVIQALVACMNKSKEMSK